jgi:hypothetical protein
MIPICIKKEELVCALHNLIEAEDNGFTDSMAVFNLESFDKRLDSQVVNYDDLIIGAKPTNQNMSNGASWGRSYSTHQTHRVVDGALQRIEE